MATQSEATDDAWVLKAVAEYGMDMAKAYTLGSPESRAIVSTVEHIRIKLREALLARETVEVPHSFVKGLRNLRDLLARAYTPDDEPDRIRLQSGRIIDGEDGQVLANIFGGIRDGLSDLLDEVD